MKCNNCNKPINKTDKFCGNCGAKITKEIDKKTMKLLKQNMFKIIVSAILLVILAVAYFLYSYLNSATHIARKYFNAVTSNDIDEVYDMLELDDTSLMNLSLLKEKISSYTDVSNIEEVDFKENGNQAIVTYKYTSSNEEKIGYVLLTKKDNKWVVDSGLIADNVTIKLPKDAKITLDDIDISSYLDTDNSSDDIDVYTIDYMPKGTYQVKITLADGTSIEEEIEITSDNTYQLGNFELKDETSETLTSTTKELVNNFYSAIINNSDTISYNNDIVDYYKDTHYNYKTSNFTLKSFNLKDIKEVSATDDNGLLSVTYQVEYEYTITYNEQDYSGTNREYITIKFDYNNNLKDIKDLDLRFPIRK